MRYPYLLPALLVASTPCLADAPSSVELYGILDAGLRSQSGLSPDNNPAPSGHTASLASGVDETSRWGIRGQQPLGAGWKAVFRLEGGLNADTGTAAKVDRLFDRQAWAGLDSPYGMLALGRQPSLLSDALLPVDPLGKRFAGFNPDINVAGLSNTRYGNHALGIQYGPSGYVDNAYRLDNTIKYTANTGPWQARAAYSAGEVAGDAAAASSHGLALAYQGEAVTLSGATMQFRSRAGLPLHAWSAGAAIRHGAWQFKANVARNVAVTAADQSVRQRVSSAGVSRAAGHGLLVTAAWYTVRRAATLWRGDGFDRAFLFVEQALAPRTTAYLETDYTTWRGDAGLTAGRANDRHGAGLTLGLMHKF